MARTALLLCLLLSACGQTGPLYLPGTDPDTDADTDTGAPVQDEAGSPAAGAQDDPGPPPAP